MEINIINNITVITPDMDTIDSLNSDDFAEELSQGIEDTQKAVLDMNNVTFLDSSGLGALLSVVRIMHGKEGRIKLCNVNPPVQVLFRMVRLGDLVEITDSREDAIASLE